jgi:hypothetical protein
MISRKSKSVIPCRTDWIQEFGKPDRELNIDYTDIIQQRRLALGRLKCEGGDFKIEGKKEKELKKY